VPPDGAAGALSEQTMTIDLPSEQMAVVGALLNRVTINGMEVPFDQTAALDAPFDRTMTVGTLFNRMSVVLNVSLD